MHEQNQLASIERAVINLCRAVGADLTLVQGPGGNASWKDGGELRVKASGTWLAEAGSRDIFVALELTGARELARAGAEDFSSCVLPGSGLRPSIETALHALMPQRVVLHVHPVDVIAQAVRRNARLRFTELLAGLNWCWVDYAKPGARLALAVAETLAGDHVPDVLVLGHHGLVVGADTVAATRELIHKVATACGMVPRQVAAAFSTSDASVQTWLAAGYTLPDQAETHGLATDPICLDLAFQRWALYPDHVVFLGALAPIARHSETPADFRRRMQDAKAVIVPGVGVFFEPAATKTQKLMLWCYWAVCSRLMAAQDVTSLSDADVAELLNWEAETYRQALASRFHDSGSECVNRFETF